MGRHKEVHAKRSADSAGTPKFPVEQAQSLLQSAPQKLEKIRRTLSSTALSRCQDIPRFPEDARNYGRLLQDKNPEIREKARFVLMFAAAKEDISDAIPEIISALMCKDLPIAADAARCCRFLAKHLTSQQRAQLVGEMEKACRKFIRREDRFVDLESPKAEAVYKAKKTFFESLDRISGDCPDVMLSPDTERRLMTLLYS